MEECCLRIGIAAVLILSMCGTIQAQTGDHTPKLLLTPQHLRRLKRDRDRQTVRWMDFENRVRNVPDSPERGFELALYYAVTSDEQRGKQAVEWALAHPCETRQRALVLDWAADLINHQDRSKLASSAECDAASSDPIMRMRDALFMQVALERDIGPLSGEDLIKELQHGAMFRAPDVLYAASEYLGVARFVEHVDLREAAPQFFSGLPAEILLSLNPSEVNHPDWKTHVAALALVTLDPNLQGSQYLQAWAMEESQMIREGPGIAYEFLWADPYLPGIGYQNLDPWVYDGDGRFFARKNWDANACWVGISKRGAMDENCPADWQSTPQTFGHVTLIPFTGECVDVPPHRPDQRMMLWRVQPSERMSSRQAKQTISLDADPAGMLELSTDIDGKICRSR